MFLPNDATDVAAGDKLNLGRLSVRQSVVLVLEMRMVMSEDYKPWGRKCSKKGHR